MRRSNFFGGLALIAVAVLLVANGMGVLPNVPWLQAIVSICLAAFSLKQIWKRHFFWSMISLGCVAWIWEGYLGIEAITPFPLLLAAGLLGVGLNMMIGKKINYQTRMTLQESLNADDNAGIIRAVRNIFFITAICEFAGFLMLCMQCLRLLLQNILQ